MNTPDSSSRDTLFFSLTIEFVNTNIDLSLSIDWSHTSMEMEDIPEELGHSHRSLFSPESESFLVSLPLEDASSAIGQRLDRFSPTIELRSDDDFSRIIRWTCLWMWTSPRKIEFISSPLRQLRSMGFSHQSIWPCSTSNRPTIETWCNQSDERWPGNQKSSFALPPSTQLIERKRLPTRNHSLGTPTNGISSLSSSSFSSFKKQFLDFGSLRWSLFQRPSCSSPFPSIKSISLFFVNKKTTEEPSIPPCHDTDWQAMHREWESMLHTLTLTPSPSRRNPMTKATIPCEQSTESALLLDETPEAKERRIVDNNRHIVSLIRRLRKAMFRHAETLR